MHVKFKKSKISVSSAGYRVVLLFSRVKKGRVLTLQPFNSELFQNDDTVIDREHGSKFYFRRHHCHH